MGPQFLEPLPFRGPREGRGQHHQPQRRRVDRPVVRRVRDLPRPRHLSHPDLVQDLAGLLLPRPVLLLSLEHRQLVQDLPRQIRVHGQRLVRRDQRVPAKQGGEPGHAGVQERIPVVVGGEEHLQIEDGSLDEPGQLDVRRLEPGAALPPPAVLALEVPPCLAERGPAGLPLADLGNDLDHQLPLLPRLELHVEPGLLRRQLSRLRREAQCGGPRYAVEAAVCDLHPVPLHRGRLGLPAAIPSHPPHLEDVEEVRSERQRDPAAALLARVVDHADLLVQAIAQHAVPGEGQVLPALPSRRIDHRHGVRQLDQLGVVPLGRGVKEHGPQAVHRQLQLRQEPRVVVIEAQGGGVAGRHVAVLIRHEERPLVLDDLGVPDVGRVHLGFGHDVILGRGGGSVTGAPGARLEVGPLSWGLP